jgi:hypothetical protein
MLRHLSLATAAGLVAILLPRPAHAIGPVDIELAGIGGYATDQLTGTLGGRAGISIFGIYAGFRGQYYFGEAITPFPGEKAYNYHQLTLGGEVGYGFKIRFITIRPFLGFGDATTYGVGSVNANGSSSPSFTQPYLQPGALLQFGFGPLIFGVDGSALIPTTEASEAAFVVDGELGVRF